jgi:glutaredoxin
MRNDDLPDAFNHSPIEIVIVTSPHCHFCEFAVEILHELGQQYHLAIREIGLDGEEGAALAARYRVPFPPVVMIDGALFGYGRISGRKLHAALSAVVGSSEDRTTADVPSEGGN